MVALFVYGTLCFPVIVEKLTGKSFFSEQAVLKGYQRKKVKNADYPAIIKDGDSEVKGLLLHNVDGDSMRIISFYEGNEYRCETLSVRVKKKKIEAKVFVWNSVVETLENIDWDQDEFAENSLEIYIKEIIPQTLKEYK